LTYTAGEVVKRFLKKWNDQTLRPSLNRKIEEIHHYVKENGFLPDFDDELTPSQQKHFKKIVECKILDRTHLILDILHNVQRLVCKNAGRIGTMSVSTRLSGMWTPRASKGNAWTR
jgi:GTP-binding protein HflX